MKIRPIASDSMGTRSMATLVETEDVKVFIDPGVSLGPSRYGLPPHPLELRRLDEHWAEIVEHARGAEVLVITHYHYDHHSPWEDLHIYDEKTVLVKHPTENINRSQRGRAAFFLERIKGRPEKLEYCDGRTFSFGGTLLRFSKPVYHGTNPRLGYVVEVLVDDGSERLLFTSDVEGPSLRDQVDFIMEARPSVLYVDGPMSYMLGYRYSRRSLEESVENLVEAVRGCPLRVLVLDHHLLRDLEWKAKMRRLLEEAVKEKVKVTTAADYAGKPEEMLEARRKELYRRCQPTGEIKTRKALGGD